MSPNKVKFLSNNRKMKRSGIIPNHKKDTAFKQGFVAFIEMKQEDIWPRERTTYQQINLLYWKFLSCEVLHLLKLAATHNDICVEEFRASLILRFPLVQYFNPLYFNYKVEKYMWENVNNLSSIRELFLFSSIL